MSNNDKLLSRDTVNFTGREMAIILNHVGVNSVIIAGCNHKWPLNLFLMKFGEAIDHFSLSNNNYYDIRLTYKSDSVVLLSASQMENPAGIQDEDPFGIPHPSIEIFPMLASMGRVDSRQYGSLQIFPAEPGVVRKVIAYPTVVNWAKAFFSGRIDMTGYPGRYKVNFRIINICSFYQHTRTYMFVLSTYTNIYVRFMNIYEHICSFYQHTRTYVFVLRLHMFVLQTYTNTYVRFMSIYEHICSFYEHT